MAFVALLIPVGDEHVAAVGAAHAQHSAPQLQADGYCPEGCYPGFQHFDLPGAAIVVPRPRPHADVQELLKEWGPPPFVFPNPDPPEPPDLDPFFIEPIVIPVGDPDVPWDLPELPPEQTAEPEDPLPDWGKVWINTAVLTLTDPVILLLQWSGPEAHEQYADARNEIRPFPYTSPEEERIGSLMELGTSLLFSLGLGLAKSAVSAAAVVDESPSAIGMAARAKKLGEATEKIGPAAAMKEHTQPLAFLEKVSPEIKKGVFHSVKGADAFFAVTDVPTYIVRVGGPGEYGAGTLFRTAQEAKAFAQELASAGESAIRNQMSLPYTFPGLLTPKVVSSVNVFQVPPGTAFMQGVVAPMKEGLSALIDNLPRFYSGMGAQVRVEPSVVGQMVQVAAVPVVAP